MSARWIEYYEIKTAGGYEYYFMPLDLDAKNKQNLDNQCHRIWKVDAKTNRFKEILNRNKTPVPATKMELFTIQLSAKPVPWDENYLLLQEMKRHREAKESSTLD